MSLPFRILPQLSEFSFQWLQIFLITHDALIKFNMAEADLNIVAESTLKLSHVLLCIAKMRDLKMDRSVSPVESISRSYQELVSMLTIV